LIAAKKIEKKELMAQSIRLIAGDLIKIFNGNERWTATEMNITEAAMIASGLAIVRVENERFIADLADIIRQTLRDSTGMDLILLTKGAFYMRKFEHSNDIYAKVHAQCMSMFNLQKLSQQEISILSSLFTQQNVMHDSPFVEARVTR
jgi:hypothetical protein